MKPLSTMLVDDDGWARDLLTSILRELDCRVLDALSGGEAAIKACQRHHVDILFLDIEMPGINGFDTLQKILEHNPDQYVIMVSAHSTLDNVKKAIDLGARGFVVKPYTSAKVRDLLEKYRQECLSPAGGQGTENAAGSEAGEQDQAEDLQLAAESRNSDG